METRQKVENSPIVIPNHPETPKSPISDRFSWADDAAQLPIVAMKQLHDLGPGNSSKPVKFAQKDQENAKLPISEYFNRAEPLPLPPKTPLNYPRDLSCLRSPSTNPFLLLRRRHHGPGMVVSNVLKERIRSHHEIERDTVKRYIGANKVFISFTSDVYFLSNAIFQFYKGLAIRASNNRHAINLFCGCPNSTNSVVVSSDSFTSTAMQSFLRVFNKDNQGHLSMGFNATFDVQVSFCLSS